MPQWEWKEVFSPVSSIAGLDAVARGTITRIFDDFESYTDDTAVQAVWTVTNGTRTLTTTANAVKGRKSVEVIVAGGTGTLTRSISNNFFGFPVGSNTGRIRYVVFKGVASTGNQTIRVRLADASDATLYKEWQFTVAQNKTTDFIIDLYSGSTSALTGGGFLNTESRSGPIAEGATAWNPELIDQISFRNLTDTITFRFDDIRFFYEYSLLDGIGFGTEPATDDGADGSLQSKLRKLSLQVQQLIGTTEQFSKSQPHTAYLNNTYTFGLELKGTAEQGIPTTGEIVPGNYTINRVRNGTTTEIVASSAASESAGFIYISYTPLEDNWQPGDQIIVTFSGGSIYNDTDTATTLTANASSGQAVIVVANAALFQVGQQVRLYDSTPDTEWLTVLSIDSPTQITFSSNLANNYTTAASAAVILVEQTILETSRLIANVTFEPELSKELQRWVLADYDDFDFADADGNNERWDIGYIANSDGSAAGAEGGTANINTTTAGQARVSVDPDATPTQSAYALKRDEPFYSKYYSVVVDADVTLNAGQATSTYAGLRISASDVDDPANYILVAREVSNAVDRIVARAEFMGVPQSTITAAITDNAVAFKIERYNNVWNIFYSLTQFPNQQWIKLTQYEDATGDMSSTTSAYLYAESGGTADAQTAVVDFDNWKYYIGSGAIDQLLSTSILGSGTFTTSSATVPADTGRLEGDNYWNGVIILPTTGVVAFQPRVIVDFTNAGGIFTIDPQNPFTSAPAVGDEYVLLYFQYPLVPSADATSNSTSAHVIGNKSDAALVTAGSASVIARLRAIETALSVNAAGGGEFELDGDPDLWDALVNNSSADASITTTTGNRDAAVIQRLAAIINAHGITDAGTATGFEEDGTGGTLWQSLIAVKGTFTTSSTTVPADTGRLEANDYFNGDLIIPLSGAMLGQARTIVDFANAGGVFTLDSELPFTAVPGLVDYVIIHFKYPLVPAADSSANTTTSHVIGNKTDTIPAMNLAPGNDSIVAQAKAILERIGATPADPDDSLLTNIGQRDDTATADTLADITTTSIQAKLRRLLLRFSSDAFSATIQGSARTDVENMLQGLANYLSSAGAAWSVTANPGGTAKDNLEQTLEDFADMLAGTTGITTFPTRVVAGDGVSIAEVLRHTSESIGEDTNNNAFASTNVVADIDGSVLERLEAISSGIIVGTGTFTTSSATVPADTGHSAKASDYFKGCILIPLTGAVAFQPRLITSFTTTTGVFTLDAEEPFTAVPGLVTYIIVTAEAALVPAANGANNTTTAHVMGNKSDSIPAMNLAPGTDSVIAHLKAILERIGATPADPDDSLLTTIGQRDDAVTVAATASVISLLRDLIAGLGIVASGAGGGFEIDGTPSLVTALGTTGSVVTDSATSVLGAIGANNADNAFDSSTVTENGDGSVLERLEELRGKTDTTGSPFTLTAAMATAEQTVVNYTPTKLGRIAALFDLQTLIDDGYVGTIIVRLKFMIDSSNLRIIDRYDFLVGTDEVHPTVSGFVIEGTNFIRLTIQANVAVDDAPAKTIPFRIIES